VISKPFILEYWLYRQFFFHHLLIILFSIEETSFHILDSIFFYNDLLCNLNFALLKMQICLLFWEYVHPWTTRLEEKVKSVERQVFKFECSLRLFIKNSHISITIYDSNSHTRVINCDVRSKISMSKLLKYKLLKIEFKKVRLLKKLYLR
jgi:hypothetical protein